MDSLGSAGEACSLFQILLRRRSRGTGISGCFYSPGEAHFCSSNSEHAPLDDNKLILIKQVGVSDLFKRGALQSMTDQRAGEPSSLSRCSNTAR